MVTADRAAKAAVVALCAYETVAITSSRLPTLSTLCRRRRMVEVALLALLLAHLHVTRRAPELEVVPWTPAHP